MGQLERITIGLSEEMIAKLRAAVAAGDYVSEDEAVRAALGDWSDARDRKQAAREKVHKLIAEGDKGPFRDSDAFFDELEAELLAHIESRDAAE